MGQLDRRIASPIGGAADIFGGPAQLQAMRQAQAETERIAREISELRQQLERKRRSSRAVPNWHESSPNWRLYGHWQCILPSPSKKS